MSVCIEQLKINMKDRGFNDFNLSIFCIAAIV